MRHHRSAKAKRRRAEIKLENAKAEFVKLMGAYLKSDSGQQLFAVIKAFDLVAETNPVAADAARVAFVRQHPVLGPMLRMMAPERDDVGSPTKSSADEIASDTQALEDFRRILIALPSGKAVLDASNAA